MKNALLDQAEDYLSRYLSEGTEIHTLFRALIDGARAGNIAGEVQSAATELQSKLPNSTASLLIQKILHGGTEAIDQWDLRRWIAATDSEKGPSHAAQSAGPQVQIPDMELGSYSLAVDGKEYQLIVEKAPQGYSARIPTVPECTTVAASATEAVSKAQRKLLAHLRDGG